MPSYDYVCEACEHKFEEFQSIKADVLRKCPECGKLKLKRLIGAGGGLIFKGSGFYTTDYRSSDYKSKAAAEESKAKPKSEKSDKKESKSSSDSSSSGSSDSTDSKSKTTTSSSSSS